MQYRGQILPLIPLGRHLDLPGGAESPEDDPVQAVVFSEGQRRIGNVLACRNRIQTSLPPLPMRLYSAA